MLSPGLSELLQKHLWSFSSENVKRREKKMIYFFLKLEFWGTKHQETQKQQQHPQTSHIFLHCHIWAVTMSFSPAQRAHPWEHTQHHGLQWVPNGNIQRRFVSASSAVVKDSWISFWDSCQTFQCPENV